MSGGGFVSLMAISGDWNYSKWGSISLQGNGMYMNGIAKTTVDFNNDTKGTATVNYSNFSLGVMVNFKFRW